jgi:hypothetical protein
MIILGAIYFELKIILPESRKEYPGYSSSKDPANIFNVSGMEPFVCEKKFFIHIYINEYQ